MRLIRKIGKAVAATWGVALFGVVACSGAPASESATTMEHAEGLLAAAPVGAVQVSASDDTACAVMTDKSLRCWGDNQYGQVGLGTVGRFRVEPTEVAGLGPVRQVGVGQGFVCALLDNADRTVRCWGRNEVGQVGVGQATDAPDPKPRGVGLFNIAQIAVGGRHACAVHDNAAHSVSCWGDNFHEQFIGLTEPFYAKPTRISLNGIQKLALGDIYSCALMTDRTVSCWGAPKRSFASTGESILSTVHKIPLSGVQDITAFNGWTVGDFDAGCAIVGDERTVQCWDAFDHVFRIGDLTGVRQVHGDEQRGCAVLGNGHVQCWGEVATYPDKPVPPPRVPVEIAFIVDAEEVTVTKSVACARRTAGGVQCWGNNSVAQLAYPGTKDMFEPYPVLGLHGLTGIKGHSFRSCAWTESGAVCWGNSYLGNGPVGGSYTPVTVNGALPGIQGMAIGMGHTCAWAVDGRAQCWGENPYGQVGDGTTFTRYQPYGVSGLAGNVAEVVVGAYFSCARLNDGRVQCWGNNAYGQLGIDVSTRWSPTPVMVNGLAGKVKGLAASFDSVCALLENGLVQCWGNNDTGQLGTGSLSPSKSSQPLNVVGLLPGAVINVYGWTTHMCATLISGGRCAGEATVTATWGAPRPIGGARRPLP